MFDPTKPVRFVRAPEVPVTILTSERPGNSVWVILSMRGDTGELEYHQIDGSGALLGHDLENIPETVDTYYNLYDDDYACGHKTQLLADQNQDRSRTRVALIKISRTDGVVSAAELVS